MNDHENRASLAAQVEHSAHQRGLARIVQVGIGFVQHQELGPAVDGTCQAYALALPAREQSAGFAHRGVVTLGQAKHHVMNTRARGRVNDLRRIELGKTRDVLGNAAVKELDVLWQVPDVRA